MRSQKVLVALCLGWFCWANAEGMARAKTPWEKGVKAFQSYQFQQAIPHFTQLLVTPPPSWTGARKASAYLYLSLCYYNLGQEPRALQLYKQAMRLDAKGRLPANMPDSVTNNYKGWKDEWARAQKPARRKPPKNHVVKSSPIARQPIARKPKPRQPKPRKRKRLALSAPQPPKPRAFRHTASLVVLGLAVVATGVAVGVTVVANQAQLQKQALVQQSHQAQAADLRAAYQSTQTMGWLATALWVTAGSAALTGGGLLLFELSKPPAQSP